VLFLSNFIISDTPTFNGKLRKLEPTDPNHADTFNAAFGQLIENDVAIKNEITKANEQIVGLGIIQTATGSKTDITLTGLNFLNGNSITFIVKYSNDGQNTKINGKALYSPGTTIAPKLISGKAVTVWYDSTKDCFFIKASASGDAVVTDVLASKKFSTEDDIDMVGTLAPKVTNILINGNFDNGLNKWVWNGVTGTPTISNNEITIIPAVQYGGIAMQYIPYKPNHTYYAKALIYGTTNTSILFASDNTNWTYTASHSSTTGWELMSIVFTPATVTAVSSSCILGIRDNGLSVNPIAAKQVMLIDLTDTFGTGKEPTKIQMDNIVNLNGGWWDTALGLLTADANTKVEYVLAGYAFYGNGMKNYGAMVSYDSSSEAVAISASSGQVYLQPNTGYHHGYAVYANDGEFIAGNILASKNVFGLQGSIVEKTAYTNSQSISVCPPDIYARIPQGAYLQNTVSGYPEIVITGQGDLIPSNILQNKVILGQTGTLVQGKKYASGTAYYSGITTSSSQTYNGVYETSERYCDYLEVTGLSFTPRIVTIRKYSGLNSNPEIYCNTSSSNGILAINHLNGDRCTYTMASPWYVASGGFKLPLLLYAATTSYVYSWEAWE
jgi:hypothetical protein